VWTDDQAVAILANYNTLLGHTLVTPRAHREQVTADFNIEEYLARNASSTRPVRRSARSRPPSGSTS
jgi:diadenosine tetraphosphate (Ap4A) HIT family hydrolase